MLHNAKVPYVNKKTLPKDELERIQHKLSPVGESFLRLDFVSIPPPVDPCRFEFIYVYVCINIYVRHVSL